LQGFCRKAPEKKPKLVAEAVSAFFAQDRRRLDDVPSEQLTEMAS
jgi:hypothetical protein